ncbi:MAG TPA: hypothetical protein PLD20_29095 [Blastocatellia bacterium]|nr:hypothetical protein [Blastocatellia bacterium]HMV85894.1 hypothetical protein [Blastocatellia bacterium]HMY72688.1 hypothetical protein [Blastocatellia bacterium]HMZ22025.1 hypothetical protein [Blastocatellia bacterium]HNG31604.1 hypothetical protein [Blastocatellia bacterium]
MEPKASKLEHLKMLQTVIARMAGNSFSVKTWCVTLVSALLGLGAKDAPKMVFVAFLPVLMFWWLDAYFLHQERLFRELFDQVRNNGQDDSDFSMKTLGKDSQVGSQFKVGMSKTLAWFYGGLLAAVTAVAVIVHFKK